MAPEITDGGTQGAEPVDVSPSGTPPEAPVSEAAAPETPPPPWLAGVSEEDFDKFLTEDPKGQEYVRRQTQATIDHNLAMAQQGRLDELDPKLRQWVQQSESRARETGAQETQRDIADRDRYAQIQQMEQGLAVGDQTWLEVYAGISDAERKELRRFQTSYEDRQAAKQASPEQRAQEYVWNTTLQIYRKHLPEVSKLSDTEWQAVMQTAFNKGGTFEGATAELFKWEAEKGVASRTTSRVIEESKTAARTSAAQQLMDGIEDPETRPGSGHSPSDAGSTNDVQELFKMALRAGRG